MDHGRYYVSCTDLRCIRPYMIRVRICIQLRERKAKLHHDRDGNRVYLRKCNKKRRKILQRVMDDERGGWAIIRSGALCLPPE